MKICKNYVSTLAILNYRSWLDASPLKAVQKFDFGDPFGGFPGSGTPKLCLNFCLLIYTVIKKKNVQKLIA